MAWHLRDRDVLARMEAMKAWPHEDPVADAAARSGSPYDHGPCPCLHQPLIAALIAAPARNLHSEPGRWN